MAIISEKWNFEPDYKNRALYVELNPCTLPLQLTPPGTLTAHERFHLVLLCSHPDTVHGFPLRKTQTSTPLIKGSYTSVRPRKSITPTRADCGYRTPLTPRLHGFISILCFCLFVNGCDEFSEFVVRHTHEQYLAIERSSIFYSYNFLNYAALLLRGYFLFDIVYLS